MSAWKYAEVLAKYVKVDDVPPRPLAKRGERRVWLANAKDAARGHVLGKIRVAIRDGLVQPGGSAEKRLAILERAVGGDIESAIKRRRDLYRRFVELWVAADAIFRASLDARSVDDMPTETVEAWARTPSQARETLPPEPFWTAVVELVESQHLRVELSRFGIPEKLYDLLVALQGLQREWEAPTDPRRIEFLASERGAEPTAEWFASACLREGLGYYETAIIDGLVHAAAKRPGDTWFDAPDAAVRRWRNAYERLFARCLGHPSTAAGSGPPRRISAIGQVPLIDLDLSALGNVLEGLRVTSGSSSQSPPRSMPCPTPPPTRKRSNRRS